MYNIEKLGESNFDSWSVQMKSVLVHLELWDVACGKLAKPEDPSEAATWVAKDEKALASILLCVKPSQVIHIKKCSTANEAWRKLQTTYEPRGPARMVSLFKKLLHLKVYGDDMVQYLNIFQETVEKLATIDVTVNEQILVIIMLSNLPDQYENFVVAIESRDTLPTLAALRIKLLEESQRRNGKEEGAAVSMETQAFMARTYGKKEKNNNGKEKKCFNCGKLGHFAAKCKAPKKKPKEQANFAVLAATEGLGLKRSSWCLDSGAKSHMCCEK